MHIFHTHIGIFLNCLRPFKQFMTYCKYFRFKKQYVNNLSPIRICFLCFIESMVCQLIEYIMKYGIFYTSLNKSLM